jgi:putative transposase
MPYNDPVKLTKNPSFDSHLLFMIYQTIRNRTRGLRILSIPLIYFDGLSLRKTSKALSRFVKISHSVIRDWIQNYKPERLSSKTKKIDEFIVDETLIKVGSECIWLWIAIDKSRK